MGKVLFIAAVQSHIMNFHIPFLEYFNEKGYEVYVATKLDEKKYHSEMKTLDWIKWKQIDFARSPFSKNTFKALKELEEFMGNHSFDIIHTHTPMGSFLGRWAAKNTKQKNVLYTAHGFHFFKGAPMSNWLLYYTAEKIAAKWTDGLLTMNEEDFDVAKKFKLRKDKKVFKVNGVGVDLNKYKVTSNPAEVRKDLGLKNDDFVITVTAEFIPRKNHIQIIEAIELLNSKYSNIKVLFVGDGELKGEIERIINEKKLENNIYILGFRKDVPDILGASDLFAIFSKHEGLTKSVIEAMACGKPVLLSNVRGNADLVEQGINGYIVEINDIKATAERIEFLYSNPALLKEMGKNAGQKVKEYSLERVMQQMDEIYRQYV